MGRKISNGLFGEATIKKRQISLESGVLRYDEGMCVQCMHVGSYDNEPETVALMDGFARNEGYDVDINGERFHHEDLFERSEESGPGEIKDGDPASVESRKRG